MQSVSCRGATERSGYSAGFFNKLLKEPAIARTQTLCFKFHLIKSHPFVFCFEARIRCAAIAATSPPKWTYSHFGKCTPITISSRCGASCACQSFADGIPACIIQVAMLFWSAVLNGVLAPPLIVIVLLLTSSRKIMGSRLNPGWLRALGWITVVVMTAASLAMFVTW
jgi:hypothetical protein